MNPIRYAQSQVSLPTARPIRVLLVDDHELMLWGLRQLVESARPLMTVSGTAKTCSELLVHPDLATTDVVVLDLGLRDANALDCVPQLVSQTGMKVIVLTGDLNPSHHRDAVMRGARGVVLKSQPTEDILHAIERVHTGEVWLDGALMSMVLRGMPGLAPARGLAEDEQARRNHSLTAKERQVVQAMVQHRGAKGLVVADALGMSEHTLRNHLTVIYSKLGVQGKLNLYVYALEHGLAHPPAVAAKPHPVPSSWGGLGFGRGSLA
jgi:two-component system nitrate/nitrite response regulator NarL